MENQCQNLEKCPFFLGRLNIKFGTDEITKKNFCFASKENCARYYAARNLGVKGVPKDLHPLQWEIAEMLVKSSREDNNGL